MEQITDILRLSKENKTALREYYAYLDGISKYVPNSLPECQKHQLNALILLSLETPLELCRFLDTSIYGLEEIINSPVYKHYTIPKKSGGERHIFAPERQLKQIQKRLNYYLQAYYLWIKPPEVHGFVINPHYLGTHCNIVANADVHTSKKHVLNIDLKDFFPSIAAKRIKTLFLSDFFSYNEQISTALTLLTTYQAALPAGAPTSPVLSNFVCLELDTELYFFCNFNGLQFTRYADDLTFSSDDLISQDIIQSIKQLIEKHGFVVNEKKLCLKSSNSKQTVTGLTVNEKVNVDRKLLKKIRAMLHDLTTNGIDTATKRHFSQTEIDDSLRERFISRLGGYINFVGQVRGKDDAVYQRFRQGIGSEKSNGITK